MGQAPCWAIGSGPIKAQSEESFGLKLRSELSTEEEGATARSADAVEIRFSRFAFCTDIHSHINIDTGDRS